MADSRPIRTDATVVEHSADGPVNRRIRLRVDGWSGFEPGQFVMLSPGVVADVQRTDPLLPRPMAVYRTQAVDGGAVVEVLYKISGRGTGLLADAQPGQRVALVGPLGQPFALPDAGEGAILVAGGTGIASVYELARQALGSGAVVVLLGARTRDDLMGIDDFEQLGVDLRIATEDGSAGERGLVTALLETALAESGEHRVYACGPTPMMRRCAEIAATLDRPCVVSLENNMACGFGVCLGCAAPLAEGGFALVCRDGPVFDAARVDWPGLP